MSKFSISNRILPYTSFIFKLNLLSIESADSKKVVIGRTYRHTNIQTNKQRQPIILAAREKTNHNHFKYSNQNNAVNKVYRDIVKNQ